MFSDSVPAARRAQDVGTAVPAAPPASQVQSSPAPPPRLLAEPPPARTTAPSSPPPQPRSPAAPAASVAAAASPPVPATPAQLAADGRAVSEKIVQWWTPPQGTTEFLDAIIEVRVAADTDGTVLAVRAVDQTRIARDARFKLWAESLEDAIVRATPLPIPRDKAEQYRLMILQFNPRVVFGSRGGGGVEIRAIQEHVARFWNPPPLSRGMRGQDFAITLFVTVEPDGAVRDVRVGAEARMDQDRLYRALAESAERAVRQASPLPVPRDGPQRPRVVALNFVPDDE